MFAERLAFDSELLGVEVAKVVLGASEDDWGLKLAMLQHNNIEVAYVFCSRPLEGVDLSPFDIGLVDRKLTYHTCLIERECAGSKGITIGTYQSGENDQRLYELALESGLYSRFRLDPRIDNNVFAKLYVTWMKKSIGGENADEVFVAKSHFGEICGMVTVQLVIRH